MKTLIISLTYILFSHSIVAQSKIIKSQKLKIELDKQISYNDSLAKSKSTYSDMKSYWILFSSRQNEMEINLIANFKYYSSTNMKGYFEYRGKIITVYEYNGIKMDDFIEKKLLKKGPLPSLTDYDNKSEIISEHEPDVRRYKIQKGNLVRGD